MPIQSERDQGEHTTYLVVKNQKKWDCRLRIDLSFPSKKHFFENNGKTLPRKS